jgi:hypothetical protein
MDDYLSREAAVSLAVVDFAIYYPDVKGSLLIERIALDPRKCNGESFRYAVGGWGVIHLQCDMRKPPGLLCRVSVNSEARANGWKDTRPSYGEPALWDWKLVDKHARRLMRAINKHAQPGAAADPPHAARR